MAITKKHIRFSIHFACHLRTNAAEATAKICAAYGENAVSLHVKDSIKNFARDFSLEDEPRAGRPSKIETDELQAGYKLCANWKKTCKTAWRYAASHFRTFTCDGKDSEGRQMGSA